jgi:hypothetical protein
MIPFEPKERPKVDVAAELDRINQAIQRLKEERVWIVQDCEDRIRELQYRRDQELERNLEDLKRLGVDFKEVPNPLPSTGRKFRKLDDSSIKEILSRVMVLEKTYTSPELTKELGISYVDFRSFVQRNSHFIFKRGKNKGTVYSRISV